MAKTSLQGSVYIFVRNGTTWSAQDKIVAGDGAEFDDFGRSVGIAGETVIVGAHSDVGGNLNQGSAYVYVRSGGVWTLQQKLTAVDGATSDLFGTSVAMTGSSVTIGASQDDIGGNNQGSAYVFTRSGTTWTQQQKLTASDGGPNDLFGNSVDISLGFSSASVIIGAHEDDVAGSNSRGSAYVYTRSGTTWSLQQKLIAADGVANDFFGRSVAISGNTVAVGAIGTNLTLQGAAYIFTRNGSVWTERQKLTAFDGAPNDAFGFSVALSSDTAFIGALFHAVGGNFAQGSAYLYRLGSKPFDFDDDGRSDISLFRPSNGTWYLQRSSQGFTGVQFGQNGDRPVAGDFDGDGRADVAVWRPATGSWYRLNSSSNQFVSVAFGSNGDIAAPADYDGDGRTDLGVFRPAAGSWYLQQSTAGFSVTGFGAAGDVPAPAASAP